MRRSLLGFALVSCLAACGPVHLGGVEGPPDDHGVDPFTEPTEAPPTGSKWQGVDVTGDCGRTFRTWVLVDEVCGGTGDPHYTDAFHAPMFRDGALVGTTLFAVDGSTLWALDVQDPKSPARRAIFTGIGEPIAAAAAGQTLLLAAGSEGLLALDVTKPDAPIITARLDTGGPALDVFVEGNRAFVAAGGGGVSVVDLEKSPPSIVETLPVPGFAAGVATAGGRAYVAACGALAIIDVATGELLGQTWLEGTSEGGVELAPARDVAVVGDVAFVAAGRYGAIAIDVSNPSEPVVLGNCTKEGEKGFYASGVRVSGDTLYVAAGEWGILPVSVADPAAACRSLVAPVIDNLPAGEQACSVDPPWAVMPWQTTWAPPPPGKDPIQTLPVGDVVYAFGDARRVGFRAVDAHAAADPALPVLGRYAEPRAATAVAAGGGKVLVLGAMGGLYQRDDTALLVPAEVTIPALASAVSAAVLDDGRWAFATTEGELFVEGLGAPIAIGAPVYEHGLRAAGAAFAVPTQTGALVFDAAKGTSSHLDAGAKAELPAALLPTPEGLVIAAPEWVSALVVSRDGASALAPHGAFDERGILDVRAWIQGIPRRLLASSDRGVVEVASLGGQARIALHGEAESGAQIPPGTYVDIAAAGARAFLVMADRGRYTSALVTVKLDEKEPRVSSVAPFTGVASGVAIDGDRLYVADADSGVRVYDVAADPALLGVVRAAGEGVSP